MKTLFYKEKAIKKWANKYYCIEIQWNKIDFYKNLSFNLKLNPSNIPSIDINLLGLFVFHFSITRKKDHAGLTLSIDILNFMLYFKIYDNRHWDDTNNKWLEHV